ncbi:hypothetical protein [Niabella beijingensis]|uniref:hypothetical protein n=1 Tax=Niabella beijingensis TaxID=2872700 RepID=UPI001CBF1A63|nr:hypothetical protein [Niabella beijingensis]MBZ4188356.1 hypothetical protein [Niabella beijingensis]
MKQSIFFSSLLLVMTLAACSKKKDAPASEVVLYETDFSTDDGHWSLGALGNNGATASIKNGYYNLEGVSEGHDVWTGSVFSQNEKGTAVEAHIKVTSTNGTKYGTGALSWGARESANNEYFNFYFVISFDGYFTVGGYPNGMSRPYVTYKDWTLNSAVKRNQFNKLRITLAEGLLHFYCNGTELYSMSSTTDHTLDHVGVSVGNYSLLQADDFKAVELP